MRAPAQRLGDSAGCSGAPGPTNTRARGTKNEPTSGPAPLSTIDPFHPARVRPCPVGNLYQPARKLTHSSPFPLMRVGLGQCMILSAAWYYLEATGVRQTL